MRNNLSILFFIVSFGAIAQMSPGNINYQAAIRDANGALITNTSVNFQFSVISNSSTGNIVFQETQSSTSNDFGLVNLKIGNGTAVIGSISAVDWSAGTYSFKVEMDASGGTNFSLFGVSEISSVPYSLFADKAATVDSVSINQISDLPSLSISNDTIDLGSFGSLHIDGSVTNEIQDLQLNGDTLSISLNPSATKVDLSGYLDNTNLTEAQVDSFANNNGYVDTTTAQTIGGAKTFNSDIKVNGITVGQGAGTGTGNTANGYQTLYSNTTGTSNTANGFQALNSNTTGIRNTATGNGALNSNTTGGYNIANGFQALYSNTTGSNNTANGSFALNKNTTGFRNTATGNSALYYNTTGVNNTATGREALYSNTTGTSNTANGNGALYSNTTGGANTANGRQALNSNTTGGNNTANGYQTLYSNTTGSSNTAIGNYALSTNTTGSENTALGNGADVSAANLTNATALGNGASVTASNTIQLGNTSVTDVKTSGTITAGDITIPNTDGTSNQVLKTDGSGTLSWATDASGASAIDGLSDAKLGGTDFSGSMLLGHQTTGTLNDAKYNVGVGLGALDAITSGDNNTAIGYKSLSSNTTGGHNTANGSLALEKTTTGSSNTANGVSALKNNTTGSNNTATGRNALAANTIGIDNTAIGSEALRHNTTGTDNTATGLGALYSNTTAKYNTANGRGALYSNTTGSGNNAFGRRALLSNTTGSSNTANGKDALQANTTGSYNTANGQDALLANTTGSYNTANGQDALLANTTGSYNTALGYGADVGAVNLTNATAIGNGALVAASNTIQLGNTSVTDVKTSGTITTGAITIPNTDGTANQVLKTDGSGTLGWATNDGSVTNEIQNIEEVLTTGNDANGKDLVDLGNVAIGSQSADASALLDVSSTTQGLLPPRMTQVQRNAISNPASGLIVWCTDCGTNGLFSGYNGTGWADLSLTSTAGTVPTVTTDAITSYGFSSATLGGNVLSNGGASILSRGVCYSSSPNPNISDNITTMTTGTGAFNDFVIGLDSNTTYYARAYATNSNGIAYGNQVTFTSKGLVSIGDFYQGGKVFYILQGGDKDYVPGEQHGLIALPFDYYATLPWSSCNSLVSTTTYIGDGDFNTNNIVDSCNINSPLGAAQMAQTNTSYGYSDWFLPSIDELVKAFANRTAAGLNLSALASDYYWSSTQSTQNPTRGALVRLVNGNTVQTAYGLKTQNSKVRIIRKF